MIDAYKLFWTKAFDFKGVSTRSQYWFSILDTFIVYFGLFVLLFITAFISDFLASIFGLLIGLFNLALIIPSISICIRITNDAGKPWPWIFINLAPLGGIYYIYLLCQPSLPIAQVYTFEYKQNRQNLINLIQLFNQYYTLIQ